MSVLSYTPILSFGLGEENDWSICWDFENIAWQPEANAVYPPPASRKVVSWTPSSEGNGLLPHDGLQPALYNFRGKGTEFSVSAVAVDDGPYIGDVGFGDGRDVPIWQRRGRGKGRGKAASAQWQLSFLHSGVAENGYAHANKSNGGPAKGLLQKSRKGIRAKGDKSNVASPKAPPWQHCVTPSSPWPPLRLEHVEERYATMGPLEAVSFAIEEFIGCTVMADTEPTFYASDFDSRVRRALATIIVQGGTEHLLAAFNLLYDCMQRTSIDKIRNRPSYLLSLLKKNFAGESNMFNIGEHPPGLGNGQAELFKTPDQSAYLTRDPVDILLDEIKEVTLTPSLSWAAADEAYRDAKHNDNQEELLPLGPAPETISSVLEYDDWPVRKALRQGRLSEALSILTQLPDGSDLSRVANKLLSTVAKTPTLNEVTTDQLRSLAGRLGGDAFEAVALEIQQRGDAAACRQLYQAAELMTIPKTSAALTSLVQGQMSNPKEANSMLAEIMATESSVEFTEDMIEVFLSVCKETHDVDLADKVLKRQWHQ